MTEIETKKALQQKETLGQIVEVDPAHKKLAELVQRWGNGDERITYKQVEEFALKLIREVVE